MEPRLKLPSQHTAASVEGGSNRLSRDLSVRSIERQKRFWKEIISLQIGSGYLT